MIEFLFSLWLHWTIFCPVACAEAYSMPRDKIIAGDCNVTAHRQNRGPTCIMR